MPPPKPLAAELPVKVLWSTVSVPVVVDAAALEALPSVMVSPDSVAVVLPLTVKTVWCHCR